MARSFAADATFSKDGQRVYLIQFDTPKLTVIDIEKQSTSQMDLRTFTGKQPIVALTLSTAGDLLFVTAHDAWTYSFEKKSCLKLCRSPEGTEFKDLACNPKNGSMLFSTWKFSKQSPNAGLREGPLLLKTDNVNLFFHSDARSDGVLRCTS
jgi:hypothetical protein